MNRAKKWFFAVALLVWMVMGAGLGQARATDETDIEALQARIAKLEAAVAWHEKLLARGGAALVLLISVTSSILFSRVADTVKRKTLPALVDKAVADSLKGETSRTKRAIAQMVSASKNEPPAS